jgi:leucyl aminopeptidase
MMHLERFEVMPKCSQVLVFAKKSDLRKDLNTDIKKFAESFLKSDDKFDFLKLPSHFVFLVKEKQTDEELRICGSKVVQNLASKYTEIAIDGKESAVYQVTEGLLLANYEFKPYKRKEEKNLTLLETIYLPNDFSEKKIKELNNITKAVFWARDRVNEPVSHLNASQLAEHAKIIADEAGISVQILEKTQIESLKMGGLLAVNKGSIAPPTFTILEYKPEKPVNKKPIVLVGKGVVYDTGGLSLKPTPGSMDCMKSDMAGAACVIGAIYLAALQELKVHVIALVPATDNRPGMNAYTPGDVITMYDGTTVEVLNTDAEGRMILADALAYANKFNPELVIDAATLTGAAVRAIGTHATIVMGNAEDNHFSMLEKSGNTVHERIVRFPFWGEYGEEMKSEIADLKNIGGPNAGMITAGKFLEHFVKAPYIHMDIAGPAWLDKKEHYRTQGGTGSGIRLLYHFLRKFK